MAGRVALIILALGALAMSLGLAVGIGTHLEGRDGARRETVILRQQPFQSEAGEAASTEGARTAVTASPTAGPVLQRFHTALAALEAGQRDKVVTVLHLGDGHISGDRLDAHMRTLLQSRFGDAGRGMLLPAGIVKGYRARGLRFDISGHWTGATALESTTAVLGLSGVQATASSPQSEMTVSLNEGRFDYVEVAFLSGPDRGSATVSIDGRPHAIDTRAPEVGVRRARLPTGGTMVMVKPAGTGPITVLSWSLMKNRPGIRYVALGLPGGAIDTFEKLDELALIDDLRALRPDLVILGYGSTEAMNDKLDVAHYQERYKGLLRLLKRMAPDASLAGCTPSGSWSRCRWCCHPSWR